MEKMIGSDFWLLGGAFEKCGNGIWGYRLHDRYGRGWKKIRMLGKRLFNQSRGEPRIFRENTLTSLLLLDRFDFTLSLAILKTVSFVPCPLV